MRDLNIEETNSVAAGGAPFLLGVLGFVWYEAGHIQSAMEAFIEGFNEAMDD